MGKHATPKLLLVGLIALLLGGCAGRNYGDKTVIEWSRARKLGEASIAEPVALAIAAQPDPSSEAIALIWRQSPAGGKEALHLVALDSQGKVIVDRDLPIAINEPTALRLVMSDDHRLHLTWLDASKGTDLVYHVALGPDGQPLNAPTQISAPGFRANGHDIAALPAGDLLLVWSSRDGLQAARIAPDGQVRQTTSLEAADSFLLDLALDRDNLAHIAWQTSLSPAEKRVNYATLDPSRMAFSSPHSLAKVMLQTSTGIGRSPERLAGPTVALEKDRVVVSWSVSQVRGDQDSAFYVTFPAGEPGELVPQPISLPPFYQPQYQTASGGLPYRQLAVPLAPDAVTSAASVRTAPDMTTADTDETALAIAMWLHTAWSPRLQPTLVILDEGEIKGFQAVGWTRYPSLHTTVGADAAANLYLAWIDAAGRSFPVYLATTNPTVKARWDRLDGTDLIVALQRAFGRLVSAFGLLLIGLSWLILPGFALILTLFAFREDSLLTTRGRAALLALIGLHWAGKLILTPDLLHTLPRLSDLPLLFPLLTLLFPRTLAYLPNELQLPAQIASLAPYLLPGLLLLVGLAVTRLAYLNRTRYPSLVPAYLILAGTDLFLSLQVYALAYYDPVVF